MHAKLFLVRYIMEYEVMKKFPADLIKFFKLLIL